MCWFEDEFLDAPVQQFRDVEFVFGWAGDSVNPAELLQLLARLAKHAENFSIQAEFINAARESVGAIEDLVRARSDANDPR